MASSAYPTFRTTLLAQLQAASWPAPAPVVADGADIVPDVQREFVLVGNAEADEDWAVLGTRKKNERMKQYVLIRVNKVADTQANTNARAFALMGVIETYLRGDPTVAGSVIVAQFKGWKLHITGDAANKWAELTCTIQVDYAWI